MCKAVADGPVGQVLAGPLLATSFVKISHEIQLIDLRMGNVEHTARTMPQKL